LLKRDNIRFATDVFPEETVIATNTRRVAAAFHLLCTPGWRLETAIKQIGKMVVADAELIGAWPAADFM